MAVALPLPITAAPPRARTLPPPSIPLLPHSKPFQLGLGAPSSLNRGARPAGRDSASPVVRGQSCPDYVPDSKFYKVEAIVRSWRIPHVSSGLLKMGIRGVTISDVKGFGAQGGSTERQGGSEFSENKFVAKTKLETVVSKHQLSLNEVTYLHPRPRLS